VRVLVTGARSLFGGATALALAARGDEVTVLQRRPADLGLPEVLADLGDAAALRHAVSGHDAVIHLAARVGAVGTEQDFVAANVQGTANLLAAARDAGVRRFVHVSTPSVAHGGEPLVGAPASPADPLRAHGHYARTKAVAERLALTADVEAAGPAVVAIRPHLVWGPGDEQLVGRIVARARAGRLPLIDTGAALIDTTYLDNAVDALLAALERAEAPDVRGRAFVVSNGQPRTVAEILTRICAAAGVPGPRARVPLPVAWAGGAAAERIWERTGRSDDPPMTSFAAEQLATAHWFDQRETRRALGWQPRVTLEEGFERLRAWFVAAEGR
jgi:2-alkyl-3-oxoalkanoate reductase